MVHRALFKVLNNRVICKHFIDFERLKHAPIVQFVSLRLTLLQKIEETEHLSWLPVCERPADNRVISVLWWRSSLLIPRVVRHWFGLDLDSLSCKAFKFVEDGSLFIKANLKDLLTTLWHTWHPEDVALHLTLADPAWVLLAREKLPLTWPWNFLLVRQLTSDYHLRAVSNESIVSGTVLDKALIGWDMLDLYGLSYPLLLIALHSLRCEELA